MQITLRVRLSTSSNSEVGPKIIGWAYDITDAPLTGTERQVTWAEAIRAASIEDFVDAVALRQARLPDGRWLKNATHMTSDVQALVATINGMIAKRLTPSLATATSAKTWLEAAGGAKTMSTVKGIIRAAQYRELSERGPPNV